MVGHVSVGSTRLHLPDYERISSFVGLIDGGSISEPWKDLSIERRARLALAVIHYIENDK